MTSAKITIEQVASFAAADSYVGTKPSRRWRRASLITTRSDGHSIASWFRAYEPAERVELVRRSLLDVAEWAPLRRVHVPKTSGAGLRALDMPTVADQGRLYLLADPIASHAEHVLSRIAVAFRRGYPLPNVLLAAAGHAKDRPFASVLDIASFFDSAPWDLVDRTIQELPADEHVRELLSSLVRADVIERPSSTRITRNAGLPQGVSLSPSLANLSLHRFDLALAHRLSSRHVLVRRACDDLLLMGPSRSAVEFGARAAAEALHRLGFSVKDGTGGVVDTRVEPVCWLGLAIGPGCLTVPDHVVAKKAAALQAQVDLGVLSRDGVEHSLAALHGYYRRLVAPAHADATLSSIARRLVVPDRRHTGKEVLRTLKSLVEDRSGRRPTRSSGNRTREPAANGDLDKDDEASTLPDASPESVEAQL